MSISKATLLNSLKFFKEYQDIANEEKFVVKEAGKMLTSNDFTDELKEKLDELGSYALPTATTSRLGGVKVGAGLVCNGNGILSCTVTGGNDYVLPTASDNVKGGVKIGNGLSMTGDVLNCTVSGATYELATRTQNGLMSASDKEKLDNLNAVAEAKVFNFKGTVNCFDDLPANGANGDVYNIKTAGGTDAHGTEVKAGDNVVWDGTGWDILAGTFELPTASTTTKGGVKIGDGLQMVGDTLNCTVTDITYSEATTLQAGLMSASDNPSKVNFALYDRYFNRR